jgi:hypothetical protein
VSNLFRRHISPKPDWGWQADGHGLAEFTGHPRRTVSPYFLFCKRWLPFFVVIINDIVKLIYHKTVAIAIIIISYLMASSIAVPLLGAKDELVYRADYVKMRLGSILCFRIN